MRVLDVMHSAASGMEGVIDAEGFYFDEEDVGQMRAARTAIAELIAATRDMVDADLSGDMTDEVVTRVRVALARCGA